MKSLTLEDAVAAILPLEFRAIVEIGFLCADIVIGVVDTSLDRTAGDTVSNCTEPIRWAGNIKRSFPGSKHRSNTPTTHKLFIESRT